MVTQQKKKKKTTQNIVALQDHYNLYSDEGGASCTNNTYKKEQLTGHDHEAHSINHHVMSLS